MTIHNPHLRDGLRENGQGLKFVNFMPLAADSDWFKTSTVFTAVANPTVTVTSFTKAYAPLWPTTCTTVVTDDTGDNWTAVTVVIDGIDQFGNVVKETVSGTNNTGTWTATGAVAWAKLTSVAITVAGTTTTSDAYVIGYGKIYGLGCKIKATGDIICSEFNNAADAGTASAVYHTYAVNGTPDAVKFLTLLVRAAPSSPEGF